MTRSTKAVLAIAFAAALAAGTAAPAMAENHPDNAVLKTQDNHPGVAPADFFPDSVVLIAQDHFPDSPAPLAPAS
ncbi:hypothetical protein [Streptomyces sp. RTd22]|uniref:hypothetical protein n=1 Tax=Streptomyces sp. RTd22 TaxID=1841249 RepID=UPI0007C4A403|nr:hypothetical protein [Streptomyces sp. RTd22]